MITKRDAITLILGAATVGRVEAGQPSTTSGAVSLWNPDQFTTWTIPLDRVRAFVVTLGNRRVEIAAADVMDALMADKP